MITDEIGEAVLGANILLQGTQIGTISSEDGRFFMGIPDSSAVLLVSYLGYESQEFVVGKRKFLNISLTPSTQQLDQVVVTGIFTRKANSYTGSIVTVKKEELMKVGNSNVITSLKNIDPSFQIIETG